jgi:hypothetical protein
MTSANLFLGAIHDAGEESQLVEEVGTLVFQSALMYYLASHDEAGNDQFETYVTEHVASESFMDDLCQEFPEFEQVLLAEMRAFQLEVLA